LNVINNLTHRFFQKQHTILRGSLYYKKTDKQSILQAGLGYEKFYIIIINIFRVA